MLTTEVVTRTPRPVRTALAAGLGFVLAVAGCGTAGAPSSAPVISVVTGNWALAQIASEVGGSHATVVDVVPAGANPRTAPLTTASAATVRAAAVVVIVGGGYQPTLEQAATSASHVVALDPAYGAAADGPWLVPGAMSKLAAALAAAMTAANPEARATYSNGVDDGTAEMGSLSADFQSSLSDCARKVIVTPDSQWAAMSSRFGLVDRSIGALSTPDAAQVRAAAVAVRAARATTLFSEPWVPDATILAAASSTGTKIKTLDTLAGTPAGGWPKGATYTRLMENDLAMLTSALQCSQIGQN